MTARVRVELGERSYDVLLGPDSARTLCAQAAQHRVALVADQHVAGLHANTVCDFVTSAGGAVDVFLIPEGEAAKTLSTVESSCRALIGAGFERGDSILALGGGAATDLAGFVAAVYLRGVRAYLLPTTLLSQVDAAIGGKTGVDLPEGKNLIGAFHQPTLVACDPLFLKTLPPREFRSGLAEVAKAAWIGDETLLQNLETNPPRDAESSPLDDVIRRAVAVKAGIISRDEREGGERAVLNFGHTIGHAIETESSGRWLHGEAVSLGLVAATHLSVAAGWCGAPVLDRMIALLEGLGLPVADRSLDAEAVILRTRVDKKRTQGEERYLLTRGAGSVSVSAHLPERAPRAAVDFLRR